MKLKDYKLKESLHLVCNAESICIVLALAFRVAFSTKVMYNKCENLDFVLCQAVCITIFWEGEQPWKFLFTLINQYEYHFSQNSVLECFMKFSFYLKKEDLLTTCSKIKGMTTSVSVLF